MHSVQFRINRMPRTECRVRGRIGGVLVSVYQWYLKRGFLGFCFFNEDETHLVNLFSSIRSHLGGPLAQLPASGKGVTVSSHWIVGRNKWLTTKRMPYIMTIVTCSTNIHVQTILTGRPGLKGKSEKELVVFMSVLIGGTWREVF